MIKLVENRNQNRTKKLIVIINDQSGAATLFMTLVLILLSTMIIIFAAEYGKLQDKAIANINRNYQAFEAGQAGLEYGINYLNKMNATILANPINGYIQPYSDSNTSNVTLSNNSKFTVTYSNPTANNYQLIKISSVGKSDDGTAIHTVSQLVKFGSTLLNIPAEPIYTKGGVALGQSSQITNQYNNTTIQSASVVTLTSNAETILSSGVSSTASAIKSDIAQNNTTLNSMSSSDFFSSMFGLSKSLIKSSISNYYVNNVDTSYRSLVSNMSGTGIWIDQTGGTATLNGPMIIGTSSNPVLIIVNGNDSFTGFVIIYGFVYVDGLITVANNANIEIIGGLAATGNLSGSGIIQVYYSPTVLSNLQSQSGMQYFAKIPGSWKDF